MQQAQNLMQKPSALLSIGEASEFLGVSIDTLRRWEKKGKLKTFRSPGGHRYFQRHELEELFGTKYQREDRHTIRKTPLVKREKVEEITVEEPPKKQVQEEQVEKPKNYYSEQLTVPQYVKQPTISKYDYPYRNIQSSPPPPQTSILAPTPSAPITPQPTPAITKNQTRLKIFISSHYKTIIFVGLGIFLVADIILFILWLTTPKIVSPIP